MLDLIRAFALMGQEVLKTVNFCLYVLRYAWFSRGGNISASFAKKETDESTAPFVFPLSLISSPKQTETLRCCNSRRRPCPRCSVVVKNGSPPDQHSGCKKLATASDPFQRNPQEIWLNRAKHPIASLTGVSHNCSFTAKQLETKIIYGLWGAARLKTKCM